MIRQDNLTPLTIRKINNFWIWFSNNDAAITNALNNDEFSEELFMQLNRSLSHISKRIGYVIKVPQKEKQQFEITFTAHGYRKLFGKVIGLENYAPTLPNWLIHAFIKPTEKIEEFKQGLDLPFVFKDFELKASDLYFSIIDYNITQKKIKIIIYLKNYKYHFDNDLLEEAVLIILQELIGEKTLKKNITLVQMTQLQDNLSNVINLFKLNQYVNKLYILKKKSIH